MSTSMLDKLAYLKKERHLTTEEISLRSGVPVGTLNKIFSGQTKNPGLHPMDRICRVLQIPVRYLLDDDIPADYSIGCYAEESGLLFLDGDEARILRQYRSLPEHGKRSLRTIADLLYECSPEEDTADGPCSKRLPCYVCDITGAPGTSSSAFGLKSISVPFNAMTREAHFSLQLANSCMEPVYHAGTLLLCKTGSVHHNQPGIFLLNHQVYTRSLYQKRGLTKLVAANKAFKDLVVHKGDNFRCLGTVLGAATKFRWC